MFGSANSIAADESGSVPSLASGFVDDLILNESSIIASGWVAPTNSDDKVVSILIKLGDQVIYDGPYESFNRPDVVAAMGRNDWLNSGWRVESKIPSGLKSGDYLTSAQVKIENGNYVSIPINERISLLKLEFDSGNYKSAPVNAVDASSTVLAKSTYSNVRTTLIVGILLFPLLTIAAFYFAQTAAASIGQRFKCQVNPVVFPVMAVISAFFFLVATGITGSSFELGLKQSPVISDGYELWGNPNPIRSDEWLILTPLAISQLNHEPKFPIINKNMGEDGQNMLVTGMTGVPINHISTLAKPATWGFYFFDLKRALAWHWWFPVFGCLLALWGVFGLIAPNYWRVGFLVSLIFCSSSYVVAWSYWPAYAAFFPSLMLCTFVALMREKENKYLMFWAVLLGFSLVGFVLVLYPPWQVSLGYLFLLLGFGITLRDKLYNYITFQKFLAILFAMGISSAVLYLWWLDAAPAIASMMNTVYPGKRYDIAGGALSMPEFLRGFTNLVTLYSVSHQYSNESEIASFYYFFPALLILFGVSIRKKRIGAVEIGLLIFIVFTLVFILVGINRQFSILTLWGRVPESRADLAMGLAYILLIGVLLTQNKSLSHTCGIFFKSFVAVASIAWALVVVYAITSMPPSIVSLFSPGISAIIVIFIIISSWWLATGDYKKFLVLHLTFLFATVASFNPLYVAPNSVLADIEPIKIDSRVLVANSQIPAMLLLASGQPVTNGIFYYPQSQIWQRLDSNASQVGLYNRYQHLIFSLDTSDLVSPYYRIENPSTDVVRVTISANRFDFSETGADALLTQAHNADFLKANSSLSFINERNSWSAFLVRKPDYE